MALRLISPPATLAVTLVEAKRHLRVDHTDDDLLIVAYLQAIIDHVDGKDGMLGRALVDQTWELVLDAFPENEIKIPLPPLIAVLSIKYDDTAGNEFTLDPTLYTVDNVKEPGWVLPDGSWPGTFDGVNSVRIRYRAGFLDTSSPPVTLVPSDIKNAMLLMVGTLYAQRETTVEGQSIMEVPGIAAAETLLRRKRVEISMA